MNRLLDAGLERLTAILLQMGKVAEEAVRLSIECFMVGVDACQRVQQLSDILVEMNVDVEDIAFELIAKYQPVASDLRIIKSYIKISNDLERYGRYAWDISFVHKRLAHFEKCKDPLAIIEEMSEKVIGMVHASIEALKTHNSELAKSLVEVENEVDALYFRHLDHSTEVSISTKCLITNTLVVRYLERIADHATYIGESIVYIATGEKVAFR
ncbi:phosphate signaling complex protein PhoU [Candidatus Bathyarchaeota archaeon]|nr:phosphate signaling complex protein PhoU [Candidatus Bathyarchaeota archaeon]